MKRYTDILVDFVVALKYKDLPSCVIEQTKLFIADYYAASQDIELISSSIRW